MACGVLNTAWLEVGNDYYLFLVNTLLWVIFLTGEGDSLSCFASQSQSSDHGGQPHTHTHKTVCLLDRRGNKFSRVYLACTYKYLVVHSGGCTCCLSWCMSLSFSLFRAITSSWAFLRLEEDSSSRAMFASFSLMAARSACCLREQQRETRGSKTESPLK